jgi:hypothetical protein
MSALQLLWSAFSSAGGAGSSRRRAPSDFSFRRLDSSDTMEAGAPGPGGGDGHGHGNSNATELLRVPLSTLRNSDPVGVGYGSDFAASAAAMPTAEPWVAGGARGGGGGLQVHHHPMECPAPLPLWCKDSPAGAILDAAEAEAEVATGQEQVQVHAGATSPPPPPPAKPPKPPTRGSLLELMHRVFVPVEDVEQSGDAAVVLVFAGLRVRVGLSCGLTDPRDIQYNAATARMTFSGEPLRIAKAVCDCASGGQVGRESRLGRMGDVRAPPRAHGSGVKPSTQGFEFFIPIPIRIPILILIPTVRWPAGHHERRGVAAAAAVGSRRWPGLPAAHAQLAGRRGGALRKAGREGGRQVPYRCRTSTSTFCGPEVRDAGAAWGGGGFGGAIRARWMGWRSALPSCRTDGEPHPSSFASHVVADACALLLLLLLLLPVPGSAANLSRRGDAALHPSPLGQPVSRKPGRCSPCFPHSLANRESHYSLRTATLRSAWRLSARNP